jgi:hypothetical protein
MDISSQSHEVLEKLFDEKLKPVLIVTNNLEKKLEGILHSLDFISSQYDAIQQKYEKYEAMLKESCQENDRLKSEVFRLNSVVQVQKNVINDLEQYTRRDCLEIKGIPQSESENTDLIVQQLGRKIGIDVKDEDISVSHRLPISRQADQNRDPLIIVKFVRRNVRDKYYEARKNLRGKSTRELGFSKVVENPIFIGESLTKQNKLLFNKCLDIKRKHGYKFIWTRMGKIYMRANERERAVLISSDKDLQKLPSL